MKTVKVSLAILMICIFSIGTSLAADKIRTGDKKQDRKKDNTCQSFLINQDAGFDMAGNQQRKGGGKGDLKRDRSCLS